MGLTQKERAEIQAARTAADKVHPEISNEMVYKAADALYELEFAEGELNNPDASVAERVKAKSYATECAKIARAAYKALLAEDPRAGSRTFRCRTVGS